jgi:hypothetical protein
LGDLREEAGFAGSFGGEAFGLGYGDVASVGYVVAQGGQPFTQAGYAQGGGTHVDTSAALSQVKWGADDCDFGGSHGVRVTGETAQYHILFESAL